MILLKAGTISVSDLERSIDLYTRYLDYEVVERGSVPLQLAESWSASGVAGNSYAVLRPASGNEIYLRFVEQPPVDGFRGLRTFGWNAVEICVSDVTQVYERLKNSPFEIIGPPRENPGLANIHPMQVKGPDEEVVFLTQINSDTPPYKLPRAVTLIDQIFIMVIGCSDMAAAVSWFEENLNLSRGEEMQIAYTMLAKAYGKDLSTQYSLTTVTHDNDVFLEVDQYPEEAIERPAHKNMLPPGCALTTFYLPRNDQTPLSEGWELSEQDGAIYSNRRSTTLIGPDGALVEVVLE